MLQLDVTTSLPNFRLQVRADISAQTIGVFGPSGAGKSTLLESVAGIRSAQGRVALKDRVFFDSSANVRLATSARGVGWVPQDALLFPGSVEKNLRAGAPRTRRRGLDPDALAAEVVATLDIGDLRTRNVDSLSGGQRRRVALARALCSAPELLLLDEPFSGLERALSRRLILFMRAVTQRFQLPLMLVTHDPVEAVLLCDHLLVLDAGKLVAQGDPRALLSQQSVAAALPESGYENAWTGSVVASRDAECHIQLAPDLELAATKSREFKGAVGEPCVVAVSARDVILARARPEGISARNCLAGRVASLSDHTGHLLVGVQLQEDCVIFSEVSPAAARELELELGASVTVVIKASACRAHA